MSGNRIENFTKTPLFSGSAQQGPHSVEQVSMKANHEGNPFETTTPAWETGNHNQGTGWVCSDFKQSILFGFSWYLHPA